MNSLTYGVSYATVAIWFVLIINFIFTIFVKKERDKFKFRFGKIKKYENLNPFKSTTWIVSVFVAFEFIAVIVNAIFFNEIVDLLVPIGLNNIPLFLLSTLFFVFWVAKHDIGASWKNKAVWTPLIGFFAILFIWMITIWLVGAK